MRDNKHTGLTILLTLICVILSALAGAASAETPPQTTPKVGTLTPWASSDHALFFSKDAAIPWLKHQPEDREWIAWGPMSMQMVIDLDFSATSQFSARGALGHADRELQKAVTAQFIQELGEVLQPGWIPEAPYIHVQLLQRNQDSSPVVCSTVGQDRMRMLIMAVAGKDYWIYIEQPEPLIKGEQAILQSDLLLPDFFRHKDGQNTWPAAQVSSQSFDRLRAFKMGGPYEPVRILLMHVAFPDTLDLTTAGYP